MSTSEESRSVRLPRSRWGRLDGQIAPEEIWASQFIVAIMEKASLSQREMGYLLRCDQSMVFRITKLKNPPRLVGWLRVMGALEVFPPHFVAGGSTPTPEEVLSHLTPGEIRQRLRSRLRY